MSQEDENSRIITELANEYYERVREYYQLQMNLTGPEEYEFIQDKLNYPETYEEHIENLKNSLKPKEDTIKHIKEFITTYTEFTSHQYIEILEYVINVIETDPDRAKQIGMQSLISVQNQLNEDNDDEDNEGKSIPSSSVNQIPDFIPFQVDNDIFELPSYQDPLLVSLYSVCIMSFNMKQQNSRLVESIELPTTELL
jgi:hypothetical protein